MRAEIANDKWKRRDTKRRKKKSTKGILWEQLIAINIYGEKST